MPQPKFPTYYGPPLPETLNLFDPRHYGLLLVWVFFQPSRLKHYLYRADPELYQASGWEPVKQSWALPAYRNIYFMSLILALVFSFLLSICLLLSTLAIQGATFDWIGLLFRLLVGTTLVAIFGLLFGLLVGLLFGVELGSGLGTGYALTTTTAIGLASGIGFSVIASILIIDGKVIGLTGALLVSIVLSMWILITVNSTGSVLGIVMGVVSSFTAGMAVSVSIGEQFSLTTAEIIVRLGVIVADMIAQFGLIVADMISWIGLMVGAEVIFRLGLIVAQMIFLLSLVVGEIFRSRLVVGLLGGVVASLTVSHLVFYPFYKLILWQQARSERDPFAQLAHYITWWNELAMFPLPGIERVLLACLTTDLPRGLAMVAKLPINPYQLGRIQRALSYFLVHHANPLTVLYEIAHLTSLEEYFVVPSNRFAFSRYPSARLVMVGEIGQQFVAISSEAGVISELFVWGLTRRQRWMKPTVLSQFSTMLYVLLRDEDVLATLEIDKIRLVQYFEASYIGVRRFKHGLEISGSFITITTFLNAHDMAALTGVRQKLTWLDKLTEPVLRPAVIETLKALGDISAEVAVFARATNSRQQMAALNRAAGTLNELTGYIQQKVLPPERVLLARVVSLWQSIIAKEQGKLGQVALLGMSPVARREVGVVDRQSAAWKRPAVPFDNPYVVGKPVDPPLLAGRKDIFDQIAAIWSAKTNPDSIILYGHRRMGKTSILRNLNQVAPVGSLIVYVDLAGETSLVNSTGALLLNLARRIYAEVGRQFPQSNLIEPDPETYHSPAQAQFHFNRLTERARDILAGQRLILALDEFEAIEDAVEEGKIGPEIYQFLRAKTLEPWLTFVLGGLHTLDEMSRDYQQPFHATYETIHVTYLAKKDAWRLITNPTDDFSLNYEPEAVKWIIYCTNGQPLLIQRICRDVLNHLNYELFDLQQERPVEITLADVEAVLDDDFFVQRTTYFDGVWTQDKQPPGYKTLLRTVARRDESWSLAELESAAGLDPEILSQALRWAERHDILRKSVGELSTWGFYVPLMREWIRRQK